MLFVLKMSLYECKKKLARQNHQNTSWLVIKEIATNQSYYKRGI